MVMRVDFCDRLRIASSPRNDGVARHGFLFIANRVEAMDRGRSNPGGREFVTILLFVTDTNVVGTNPSQRDHII